ncbi:phage virion morphogenesis protein [Nitrosomonas sp. Nm58]|uniref:phage virion morphogenesis protein n=1 Tax=Nitrosomonas sp. Nm58 TaxID=200126 RepID=UPI000899F731|nr:phage virion morphogenesis protein [Nitrosomonas sp. Nm58]SDY24108.1 phage virion morphogenesis (putative tail completion) protein [Nitrosomonas sp. Nm58]
MAVQSFEISYEDARIRASLQRLMALGRDQSKVMQAIANKLEQSTRQRFISQSGPDGEKWKPSLRAQLTGKRTLIQDRHLLDSVAHASGSDFAEVSVNRVYAAIHQFGGVIKAKNGKGLRFRLANGEFVLRKSVTIPARPYMGISTQDENWILKRIERAIDEAANAR